jgi:cytochrome P450
VDDHQVLIMHEATPRPLLLLLVIIITPLVLLLLLRRSSSNDGDKVQPHASSKTTSTKENPILPPSPPGLPVIGHLHLIGANPYVSLRDLAARYGNGGLALLRLGTVPNLVVSSPRAARAVLRTHDHTFASRPTSTLSDALLYRSSDVAFSPYGEHWRQLKKIVTAHLFTTKKVRSFGDARQQEVRLVMAKIRRHESEGTAVDVSETVDAFTNDVVCRAVSGKSFRAEGQDRLFRELIEMNNSMFGGFSLLEDYYPWVARSSLTWLVRGRAREGHKRWDDLLEKIITDHESRRSSACDKQDGAISERPQDESDFIDVVLSVQQEYGISRDHIKAILMVKYRFFLPFSVHKKTKETDPYIFQI